MKLSVDRENGKTVCRGKAWAFGQPEPAKWMLTMDDPTPNLSGSPGLWGFSNAHDIYYDNLVVTPNGHDGSARAGNGKTRAPNAIASAPNATASAGNAAGH
jgi:hypothetical protein